MSEVPLYRDVKTGLDACCYLGESIFLPESGNEQNYARALNITSETELRSKLS